MAAVFSVECRPLSVVCPITGPVGVAERDPTTSLLLPLSGVALFEPAEESRALVMSYLCKINIYSVWKIYSICLNVSMLKDESRYKKRTLK